VDFGVYHGAYIDNFKPWSKNPRNKFKSFKSIQTSPKMVCAWMPSAHNHARNTPATMLAIPLSGFNPWGKNPRNNFKRFKSIKLDSKNGPLATTMIAIPLSGFQLLE
jgi:hypothetical protein